MVADLIEYTRSQLGGGMPIDLQSENLKETGSWALDDARDVQPECLSEMDASGDLQGEYDKVRLHQLLTNLLMNAAQYGTAGSPVRLTLEIAHQYVAEKRTKHGILRQASKDDITQVLDLYMKDWLDRPIATITRDRCVERFDSLSKKSASQANKTMVTLRALCNWAREQYASDEESPLLPVNPVTRMFKVRRKNPEPARTSRLPIEKVGDVWAMLKKRRVEGRTVEDRTSAAFVAFLLLTGARRGETGSLVWDDVHIDEG